MLAGYGCVRKDDGMFGYIKTVQGELRLREYEYYRASYCGLCRSMGQCTGQCSRLALSYDFVFLANVRMSLRGTVPVFRRRRCLAHPIKKRRMMEPNEELNYTAQAAALLAFEKCRDDMTDERGWRKIRARLRCFFLKKAYKRAKKHYPLLAERLSDHLGRLREKESEQRPSVDEIAALFGDLLADIVAEGMTGEQERVARAIGWQTGRFIYIVDALDDLPEDLKRKRFNPFLLLYGRLPEPAEKEGVRHALTACLADLETAFDLVPEQTVAERGAVLENILYFGMPATVRRVLRDETDEREEADYI